MADKRISGLPALSFSTKEDILMVVNDPAGTPSNKKISVENFFSNVEPKIFFSNTANVVDSSDASVVFKGGVGFQKDIRIDGDITIDGNTTINTISLNSFSSNVNPETDDIYNLGNTASAFKNLYAGVINGNTSGNLLITAITNVASNLQFTSDNVVFETTDLNVSSNSVFSAKFTINSQSSNTNIESANLYINSTGTNIDGSDLKISANTIVSANLHHNGRDFTSNGINFYGNNDTSTFYGNVRIGVTETDGNPRGSDTDQTLVVSTNEALVNSSSFKVQGTDLNVSSNLEFTGTNLTFLGDESTTNAYFDTNVTLDHKLNVGGNTTVDGANLHVTGTNTSLTATGTNIEGTLLRISSNVNFLSSGANEGAISIANQDDSTTNTSGALTVSGGVGVAKKVTVGEDLLVHGNIHANGNITSDGGTVTLGNNTPTGSGDTVAFAATISSNVIPTTDVTFDLGNTTNQFANGYVKNLLTSENVITTGTVQSAKGEFSDNVEILTDKSLVFRDSGLEINSPNDGDIRISSDDKITFLSTANLEINTAILYSNTTTRFDVEGPLLNVTANLTHTGANATFSGTEFNVTGTLANVTSSINFSGTVNTTSQTNFKGKVVSGIDGTGQDLTFNADTISFLSGNVKTLGTATQTYSDHTDGIYDNVTLTGGNGFGIKSTVYVSGGQVVQVIVTNGGFNYEISDSLTIPKTSIGNTGSGDETISVSTLNATSSNQKFELFSNDNIITSDIQLNQNSKLKANKGVTLGGESGLVFGGDMIMNNDGDGEAGAILLERDGDADGKSTLQLEDLTNTDKIESSADGFVFSGNIVFPANTTGFNSQDGTLNLGTHNGVANGVIRISDAYNLPNTAGSDGQYLRLLNGNLVFASGTGVNLTDVVQDATPQLGGNLDLNGNFITDFGRANTVISARSGDGLIVLNDSSTQYVAVSKNGRLGVGVDPQRPLHVVGDSLITGSLEISTNLDVGNHDGSSVGFKLGGTLVTSSANELNVLDGIGTLSTNDLKAIENFEETVSATTSTVTIKSSKDLDVAGHDESTNGLKLGGTLVTSSATELNILDGVTTSTTELNLLDGLTASSTDLNLTSGITLGSVDASKLISADSNKIVNFGDTLGRVYVGQVNVTSTTNSTSNTTGALKSAGGLAVKKSATIGDNLTVHGNTVFNTDFTLNGSTTDFLTSWDSSADSLSIKARAVGIGDTTITTGAGGIGDANNVLAFSNGVVPTNFPTGQSYIVARPVTVGENQISQLFFIDEAGNQTQGSPHNAEGEWEFYSKNLKTGKVVRINMERMIRILEDHTGEKFIEEE